jgi:dolichol-phosphate mannosyltransferase
MNNSTDYSIVLPVYYNEGSLRTTLAAIKEQVMQWNPGRTCAIIFVDDGSGDGSLKELLSLRAENPSLVTVIKLTRNFGQVNALFAGFAHAKSRCVIAMSADGQDPPGLINQMLCAYFNEGYEIAICSRASRDESWFREVTSRMFYGLIKMLTFPMMPRGGFDYVLLSSRVIDIILRNKDANPFFQGQILWTGFPIKHYEYRRQKRLCGTSRWTLGRKITYLIDGVMSYSYLPLRMISLTGGLFATMGFSYAAIILLVKIINGNPIKGWSPLMIVVLIMGGIQMVMLGVVGEYLWRTLAQTRNRDAYVVDRVYGDPS